MRLILSALVALGLLALFAPEHASVEAVPASRFNKPVDDRKLDEAWKDEEDEEWHEDTYDWKKKMAEKKRKPISLEDIQKAKDPKEVVLQQEASSGNMQMAFATLKKSYAKTKKDAEEIGQKWQALLQTNGVSTNLYPISDEDLLFTDDNGKIMEIKDFVLNQPELEKFRWKDTDFFPTPTPEPGQEEGQGKAAAAAAGSGKAKKKGSKSSKKAAAALKRKQREEEEEAAEEEAERLKELERQARKAAAAKKAKKAEKKAKKEKKAKLAAAAAAKEAAEEPVVAPGAEAAIPNPRPVPTPQAEASKEEL